LDRWIAKDEWNDLTLAQQNKARELTAIRQGKPPPPKLLENTFKRVWKGAGAGKRKKGNETKGKSSVAVGSTSSLGDDNSKRHKSSQVVTKQILPTPPLQMMKTVTDYKWEQSDKWAGLMAVLDAQGPTLDLDSHAEFAFLGINSCRVIFDTGRTLQVYGYDPSQGSTTRSVVSGCFAYDDPHDGTVKIFVVHQGVHVPGLSNLLIPPNQMRDNEVVVNECPKSI
jgi:hypothetical protein